MRSLRSSPSIAALLLLLAAVMYSGHALAAAAPQRGILLGGWTPIEDINNPRVKAIADFAVTEHNKLENSGLALGKVVKGETQVVAGINYRLVLSANEGNGAPAKYVAVVWEKAWENFRQLRSFKPLDA